MKKFLVIPALLVALVTQGCTANYQTAQNVETGITIAENLAAAELPVLVQSGQMSQADAQVVLGMVTAVDTQRLNLHACNVNAQNSTISNSGKFVDCLGIFAQSLSSPQVLASLHILNPASQIKAQAYIAAFVAAVNVGLLAFHAQAINVPVITTLPGAKAASDQFISHVRDVYAGR